MADASTMSPRIHRARNISIASLIIAIIMILSCAYTCYVYGMMSLEVLNNPTGETATTLSASFSYDSLFVGSGTTETESTAAFCALFAVFFGFGAILNLIPLMASVGILRNASKANNKQRTYMVPAIGAGVAFLTFNPVNGILLTVSAVSIYHDYVDSVGEAIAYKDGKRLGAMRFIEVIAVFDLLATVGVLIFVTKSDYGVYNIMWWVEFCKLVMESVALWFIWNRKQHGREVIMGMAICYLMLYLIGTVVSGSDVMSGTAIISCLLPTVMMLYFAFAKRPRAIFTEPFKVVNREKQLIENEKLWNPRNWRFWRNLGLYFCIFSVIGHWMEWCVCWIIRIGLEYGITLGTYDPNSGIWSNMLNPFFVYGAALVLIGLILYPVRNVLYRKISNRWAAFFASFLFNMLVVAVLELAIGLAQNGDYTLWDYRSMPFNFMGQICLLNTTFFTVMATVFNNLVYPNLEKAFAKIPDDVMNILTVTVLVFFVLVVSMYVVNLPGVNVTKLT